MQLLFSFYPFVCLSVCLHRKKQKTTDYWTTDPGTNMCYQSTQVVIKFLVTFDLEFYLKSYVRFLYKNIAYYLKTTGQTLKF